MTDEILNVAEFDFGITRLAGEFHQDWRCYAETPGGLVHTWISELGEQRPKKVSLLLEDAQRMLGSELSAASLDALWNACVPSRTPARFFERDGRDWLLQVSDIARGWLAENSGSELDAFPPCRHDPLPDPARHWIEKTASTGGLVQQRVSDSEFLVAWGKIADSVCPELALRIAVRSLLNSAHPVPAYIYEELERRGAAYGYGEFLVAALEHLIDS
ncbi:hypothetical protein OIB37_29565 [Streptomyces sp. NBC_00820]|uniref:hypothetical protein n=1 Tax=Streptomyces sp. NBC_00820 TaxID=2975842 RepID=UPI002ED06C46|nr:hypothetical protein OIB37_29565 [Streptomyces sp. NBC_00820]